MTARVLLIFAALVLGLFAIFYMGYLCGRCDTFAEIADAFASILDEDGDEYDR